MQHELKMAMVIDGYTDKGKRYMGVRYCVHCLVAEPALGLFYTVPERAHIFTRSELHITVYGFPKECGSQSQRPGKESNNDSQKEA